MSIRKRRKGAALLEFAMALPFALTLFVGISDFSAFFWRQTRMEEAARFTSAKMTPDLRGLITADDAGLVRYALALQEETRKGIDSKDLSLSLSRHYACPLANGAEEQETEHPRHCAEERVYLRIASGEPVEPLLRPLRLVGFPPKAISRHAIRLR